LRKPRNESSRGRGHADPDGRRQEQRVDPVVGDTIEQLVERRRGDHVVGCADRQHRHQERLQLRGVVQRQRVQRRVPV
jgi:hypothetical protein